MVGRFLSREQIASHCARKPPPPPKKDTYANIPTSHIQSHTHSALVKTHACAHTDKQAHSAGWIYYQGAVSHRRCNIYTITLSEEKKTAIYLFPGEDGPGAGSVMLCDTVT